MNHDYELEQRMHPENFEPTLDDLEGSDNFHQAFQELAEIEKESQENLSIYEELHYQFQQTI